MNSLGLTISIGTILALLLQSASCFLSEKRSLSIGFLDLLLALLVLPAVLFLFTGQMVLGVEFGAVMIQGDAKAFMRIALVLVPVLPALCWYGDS